ncbi:contact-dependent growth inhibition system immunity protein [Gorillibacterium sp. sgz5001074]|uniref:contact-dependent growth inhibition system immunity protein n=1 Tax=Gorillibacterium sp. sgz5001074 TaxID=3446695 RepID=UPI003F667237
MFYRLVIRAHELRKKPLDEFSDEDLRLLILQQISLDFLLPIALKRLADNPLRFGDLYVGDLLCSVLQVDKEYWRNNREIKYEMDEIVRVYEDARDTVDIYINKFRSE